MWLVHGCNDLDRIYQCIDITMYWYINEWIFQYIDLAEWSIEIKNDSLLKCTEVNLLMPLKAMYFLKLPALKKVESLFCWVLYADTQ